MLIHLTKEERMVVCVLFTVLISGSVLTYVIKQYPDIHRLVNLIDSPALYPKVDVNAATFEELVAVPYIGKYTARQIMAYRRQRDGIESVEELRELKGVRSGNYEIFSKYLKVRR